MKRWLSLLVAALLLVGCHSPESTGSAASATQTLTVAASAVPHAQILQAVKPLLAEQGIDLQIKVFTDYVQPNLQVLERNIDVSYFETRPYLEAFNRQRHANLVTITGVHIEPFGAYSRKYHAIGQLPDGASVMLPNDDANASRALWLLAKHGLITLDHGDDRPVALKDIASSPKHLQFRQREAPMLAHALDTTDLVLINTNYALAAGLHPTQDALLIEDKDSPYVNYLVGRLDNRDDPRVQKLAQALHSATIRDFIERTYHGAVLPAF